MKVKNDLFSRGSFNIGNGQNARFWEDTWLGDVPLKDQYPSLYNVVNHTNVTVAHVFSLAPLNIGFRRTLSGNRWDRWVHLVTRLTRVQITDQVDTFKWDLTTSGFFFGEINVQWFNKWAHGIS
jgi:hypothetical protein